MDVVDFFSSIWNNSTFTSWLIQFDCLIDAADGIWYTWAKDKQLAQIKAVGIDWKKRFFYKKSKVKQSLSKAHKEEISVLWRVED